MNTNENINTTCENEVTCCAECGCCDEDLFEVDGRLLCEDCLTRLGYERCERCGEWTRNGLVTIDNGWRRANEDVCEDCREHLERTGDIFYCEDCETWYASRYSGSYVTGDGTTICEYCASDHWYCCDDCGELFRDEDITWSEEDDCYYCDNCCRHHRGRAIHDYSYKPTPVFHGLETVRPRYNDPLTFGFELEVDEGSDRRSCAEELDTIFGENVLYMKNDSSVDFEIVTHPHTLKAYFEDFDFFRLCKIPTEYGYKSHNAGTCGFHIHVGRAQLGATERERDLVISNIVLLMYKHWNSLVKFSRRTSSQLSQWAAAPQLMFATEYVKYDDAALYQLVRDQYTSSYNRYRALNLCNSGTIEFRLWRGSLKHNTLKATLQLTSNIVRFAMSHDAEAMAKSTWSDITDYETCPELTEYLIERGLVEGLPVQEVPYDNEVRVQKKTAAPDPEVGDEVRIVRGDTLVSEGMIGCGGIVVACRHTDYDGDQYALAINTSACNQAQRNSLHDCDGLVESGLGYWVHANCVVDIDAEHDGFLPGDPVWLTSDFTPFGPAIGSTGVVINNRNGMGIGVSFNGFTNGHNLDGDMPSNRCQTSGWYVSSNFINRIV